MKYSMVKQFSNAAIDNAFGFIFKIVDFGKLMVEVFWAFIDIWSAFFLIFINFFMYIYYFFLFLVDRGSETGGPVTMRAKRGIQKKSKIPTVTITSGPNPIPAMYQVRKAAGDAGKTISETVSSAASVASDTAQKVMVPLKPSGTGSKRNILKSVLEFIADFFTAVKDIITKPFIFIGGFFAGRMKPVRESDVKASESGKRGSLIDEYMKEYEKNKKR